MKLVQLALNKVGSENEVHNLLMEQMQFPQEYEKNLDALFDVLTSKLEDNYCVELTRCEKKDTKLADFFSELEQIFVDAARSLDERDGKLYAVFEDTRSVEFNSSWQ